MKYSYSKDIKSTFQDAENKVREELIKVGFEILTEINIKNAFKLKLDLDYKHYKILGACNPTLAHQALDSENLIGILMPCNILIIDNEDESIKIVFPFAKNLLEITDNNNILKLSEEVDLLMKKAFSNIE